MFCGRHSDLTRKYQSLVKDTINDLFTVENSKNKSIVQYLLLGNEIQAAILVPQPPAASKQ